MARLIWRMPTELVVSLPERFGGARRCVLHRQTRAETRRFRFRGDPQTGVPRPSDAQQVTGSISK